MRRLFTLFAIIWASQSYAQSLDFHLQNAPNTTITLQHITGTILQDTTTWRTHTDASGQARISLTGLSANAATTATPLRVHLGDSLRFELWITTDAHLRVQLDYLDPATSFQCQGATASPSTWLFHLSLRTQAPQVLSRYGITADIAPLASPHWMKPAPTDYTADTQFQDYAQHRHLIALHAAPLHKAMRQPALPTDVIDDWSYLWRSSATSQVYYADFLQAYFLYRSCLDYPLNHAAPTLPQCYALTERLPEAQQGAFPRILLLWKALTPQSNADGSKALAYQHPTQAAFAERQLNLLAQRLPQDALQLLQSRIIQRPKFDPNGPAPDFTLTYENGQTLSLSQLRGKVVFLTFWASWSHKSLQEFARTVGIREQLMDKGVVVLTVSFDTSPDDWQRALDRYATIGEHLRAHDQPQLRDLYQVKQFPAYYLINREGQLVPMPSGSVRFIDYVTGL